MKLRRTWPTNIRPFLLEGHGTKSGKYEIDLK